MRNNNKLINSIDQLSDKYIEEALDMPIRTTPTPKAEIRPKKHIFPRKLITAAAMLCIGLGIGYVAQNILPDTPSMPGQVSQKPTSTPDKKSSIFSPLTVTAYAAERSGNSINTIDEGVSMPENVPIVLSEYSPLMSSVPAMPFSFSYEKESVDGEIHFVVRADPLGSLQKYQQLSGIWKLVEESKSLECKPNEKIYWEPSSIFYSINENNLDQKQQDIYPSDEEWINTDTLASDSIITVEVYEDETLLETQYIGISYQNLQYTATLKLTVSPEQCDEYDDFTITSRAYGTTDEETHKKVLDALTDPDRILPGGERLGEHGQSIGRGGQAGKPSSQSSDGEDDEDDEYEIHAE